MFRKRKKKKKLGKCAMFIGVKVIPRRFCPTFLFLPVLIQHH